MTRLQKIHVAISLIFALLTLTIAGTIIAQEPTIPAAPPDSAPGLTTFAERCANCHGPLGQGDGELAVNLSNPPPSFADPDFIRQAVPTVLFDTITNGRIPNNMPPFGPSSTNPLPEESRWQAIAAIYSLATTAESIEQGQIVYEENCLACHGESGEGDEANDSNPPSLTNLTYWSSNSNQTVFDILTDSTQITAHDYDLQDDTIWAVVDYIRTFSYDYTDPLAASQPLETATITGLVTNGTTIEPAPPDTEVRLRAFTADLEAALTLTTTTDVDGRYQFDLTDTPQDWVFRTAVFYNDIEFGSDFSQLTFSQPEIELPIIIYEKSTDSAIITVNQLHTIVTNPTNETVEVNQLYVVSNSGNAVYAGPSGNVEDGTFELALPADAELLEFQRGFGTLDSFFPTDELIPTANGWVDTLPVRPGQTSLVLLARYTLPYAGSTTLSHPLFYNTAELNLVVPEGITITGQNGWQDTGLQTLENSTFSTYQQINFPAQSTLTATLNGFPRQTTGVVGRNETVELLVGGGALLIVIAIAVFTIRQWQVPTYPIADQKADLLQEIADLDDEFEAGKLNKSQYLSERESLMAELKAIWTK